MPDNQKPHPMKPLRAGARWQDLHLYHKADAVYQLTCVFCRRFLPPYGDRTVDQMIQAARSGKQNIVEGSEDGKTSTEMEMKLINVARASFGELKEDYLDHLKTHHLPIWNSSHPRYASMQYYTKSHNDAKDYLQFSEKWSAEEFCNTCLTLCFQLDAMLNKYLKHLQEVFTKYGGIKERLYSARTGYRKGQDDKIKALEAENLALKNELSLWKDKYEVLRLRAVTAYNEIKSKLNEKEE